LAAVVSGIIEGGWGRFETHRTILGHGHFDALSVRDENMDGNLDTVSTVLIMGLLSPSTPKQPEQVIAYGNGDGTFRCLPGQTVSCIPQSMVCAVPLIRFCQAGGTFGQCECRNPDGGAGP
jgi:hypothetical protein